MELCGWKFLKLLMTMMMLIMMMMKKSTTVHVTEMIDKVTKNHTLLSPYIILLFEIEKLNSNNLYTCRNNHVSNFFIVNIYIYAVLSTISLTFKQNHVIGNMVHILQTGNLPHLIVEVRSYKRHIKYH